jgi:hypothetical protein
MQTLAGMTTHGLIDLAGVGLAAIGEPSVRLRPRIRADVKGPSHAGTVAPPDPRVLAENQKRLRISHPRGRDLGAEW